MPCSRVIGVALLAALLLAAHSRASTFVDVTANAGLNHLQYDLPDPPTERDFQTYLTGGAAAADYNRDGWVDLSRASMAPIFSTAIGVMEPSKR